ncbi:hypothetical protein TrRE_jg2184 [Triparma retinervis]|uniref:Myb-like domain-containing protein n=1 Tax=Triparma retinervis TaxID=2557542 RepID=A0A9W7F7T3_9STRA|nr:hypothetical protein TrRE_jg2184 [Triparma retinervis]
MTTPGRILFNARVDLSCISMSATLLVAQSGAKFSFFEDRYGNVISPEARPGSLLAYEIDHDIPRSRGGNTLYRNLHAIHSIANKKKGSRKGSEVPAGSMATGLNRVHFEKLFLHLQETFTTKRLSVVVDRLLFRAPPARSSAFGGLNLRWGVFSSQLAQYNGATRSEVDGGRLFDFIEAYMGGARIRRAPARKAARQKFSRCRWSDRETKLFKASLSKHGEGEWVKIRDDKSRGSWGRSYGGTRDNVALKDKARQLKNGGEKARQKFVGSNRRHPWSEEEVQSFKNSYVRLIASSSSERGKVGIWAAMFDDPAPSGWGKRHGGRSVVNLKDKFRTETRGGWVPT